MITKIKITDASVIAVCATVVLLFFLVLLGIDMQKWTEREYIKHGYTQVQKFGSPKWVKNASHE